MTIHSPILFGVIILVTRCAMQPSAPRTVGQTAAAEKAVGEDEAPRT
jgi:hypothetical protein